MVRWWINFGQTTNETDVLGIFFVSNKTLWWYQAISTMLNLGYN